MPHSIAALNPARHAGITQALRQASAEAGVDFDYLVSTAMRESSLDPEARAATSSATGLFQFTEQTWLDVIKRHGAEHGLGAAAAHIIQPDGRYKVPDAEMRQAILALRNDPKTASLMAGEFTAENRQKLESGLERPVSEGELYAAHVMGAGGAVQLIAASEADPSLNAVNLFPAAAKANRGIFFEASGRARSVAEVTGFLTGESNKPAPEAATEMAAAPATQAPLPQYDVASLALPDSSPEAAPAEKMQWIPATPAANGGWNGSLKRAAVSAGTFAGLAHNANSLSPGMIAILASLDAPETHRNERAYIPKAASEMLS